VFVIDSAWLKVNATVGILRLARGRPQVFHSAAPVCAVLLRVAPLHSLIVVLNLVDVVVVKGVHKRFGILFE